MSQENVEIARKMTEAFNRKDDAWLDYYGPDVEYVMPAEWPEDAVYKGRDGLRRLADALESVFERREWRIDRLIDAGDDRIVLLGHVYGLIGDAQGLAQPVAAVQYFDGGKVARQLNYSSWAEALKAVGLEG